MKRVLLTLAIGLTSLAAFSNVQFKPGLRLIVGITGEDGVVALQDGKISMFSSKNIGIIGADSRKVKFLENAEGVVSLGFKDSGWKQMDSHLELSAASAPMLCDRLNQINICSIEKMVSKVLPKGSRIKAVKSTGGYFYVVYSASKNTVKYDIHIAMLGPRSGGGFKLIKNDLVTEAGAFCGMRDAGDNLLYLIVDEPSGSSDRLAVYVYSLAG